MRKRVNKMKFLRSKGLFLSALGLLITGLAVLLVFGLDPIMGQASAGIKKPPPKPTPALYRIYLSTTPGAMGIDTLIDPCNGYDYVLAEWSDAHNFLKANGTFVDPANGQRIPLSMRLLTDVPWQRKYDAGKGLSGVFNGCYGETDSYDGAFYIGFEKKKGKYTIFFTWYFDYYTAPDIREHFAFFSEKIPFQAWTGEDLTGQAEGWFDLQYYLNDPDNLPSYVTLTDDQGRDLSIHLNIVKVNQ